MWYPNNVYENKMAQSVNLCNDIQSLWIVLMLRPFVQVTGYRAVGIGGGGHGGPCPPIICTNIPPKKKQFKKKNKKKIMCAPQSVIASYGPGIIYVVKQVDLSLIPPQTTSQFSHDLVHT